MKVNNDCQLNFRSAEFTPRALKAMSERMPSGRFYAVQEKFVSMYKNLPLNVIVDTMSERGKRLSVKVQEPGKNVLSFIDYIQEPLVYSIFCSPEKFIKKVCKDIDKLEVKLFGKVISRGELDLML